jgi:hypothetical protein
VSEEGCIDDVMRYVFCPICISYRIYGGDLVYLVSWLSILQGTFRPTLSMTCSLPNYTLLFFPLNVVELNGIATVVVE